jgi:DNA invertase Pin-like site-specific DNA recombinase
MRLEMQIGYARSSTVDQEAGFQAQIKSLKAAGCENVRSRAGELEAALDYAREGDILVVTKLDRLARSVSHLVAGWTRRPSLLGCLSKPSTRPIAPAV